MRLSSAFRLCLTELRWCENSERRYPDVATILTAVVLTIKKDQPPASTNNAKVGTKTITVAMSSGEFQEWNSFATRKGSRTWLAHVLWKGITLLFPAILASASSFQITTIVFVLILVKSLAFSQEPAHPHTDALLVITALRFLAQLLIAGVLLIEHHWDWYSHRDLSAEVGVWSVALVACM